MLGCYVPRVWRGLEGKGRGGRGRLAAGAGTAVGGTPYTLPRSIGGGEISPQDLGAHLWVRTDEPTTDTLAESPPQTMPGHTHD